MTKKERVIAAIQLQEPDKIPSMFSLHFPEDQHKGEEAVKAHLAFFRETDADIAKIMNEYLIHAHNDIHTVDDYAHVGRYSVEAGFMKKQVDLTAEIAKAAGDDVFTLATLHGITASGIHPIETRGVPYETCREMLCSFLREDREKTVEQLQKTTDMLCDLARAYVENGVDGVYYASLGGEPGYFTDEEFASVIKPMDLQVLKAIRDAGGYSFLHICKAPVKLERYADYAPYADVINFGVCENGVTLEDVRALFPGKCILGGLASRGVLYTGDEEAIRSEVRSLVDGFGRRGFILGADCTVPTDIDRSRLATAIRAARGE